MSRRLFSSFAALAAFPLLAAFPALAAVSADSAVPANAAVPANFPASAARFAVSAYEPAVWENFFPRGLIKAGQKASAGKKENLKLLDGKFVGVYHTASWCGFCRVLTPQLVDFSKRNKDAFVVVLCSADKSERDMIAYCRQYKMNKANWLALPFGTPPGGNIGFSGGLPQLIVFSPDGKQFSVITGAKETPDPRLETTEREMRRWLKKNTAPAENSSRSRNF